MKKVIIAGASGMVGKLLLKKCLLSEEVEKVISVVRHNSGNNQCKLEEVVVKDFKDYSEYQNLFTNIDAAFFCIGVYTGKVKETEFKTITVDFAVQFAYAIKTNSPNANFCLLSGAGADRTEKSRTAFAKYKGMAENQISAFNLNFYSFRPGYIYPVTPRNEPNIMYSIFRALYPLIKLTGKNTSIKSTELALAMFKVGIHGANKEVLENKDVLALLA